jgi:uncharacterized membrane protein
LSISQVVVWVELLSFAGWIFESTYCTISGGAWEKRGFLYGPVCPIYGISATIAILVFDNPAVASGAVAPWMVFLVCMAGSAVIEYLTSYVLEKSFGAVWWDYSNMPLNLNGRICLPASLVFGVMGLAVTYLLIPLVHVVNAIVPDVAFETGALALSAITASDVTLTVSSLSDLLKKVQAYDASANAAMSRAYFTATTTIRETPERIRESGTDMIDRANETVAEKQETLRAFIGGLTQHQRLVLRHAKRFDFKRLMVTPSLLHRAIREARLFDRRRKR